MKQGLIGLLGVVFLMSAGSRALAHPLPCSWDPFTPMLFFEQIKGDLPMIAASAVEGRVPGLSLDAGTSILLKDGLVVGSVALTSDVRRGRSSMSVFDASQVLLFQVTKDERLCDGAGTTGVCESIVIVSEQQPLREEKSPFSLELVPGDYWPHYYRYGTEMPFMAWRHELVEAYRWLGATLDDTELAYQPPNQAPVDRLFWALASDPDAVRYLPRLSLSTVGGYVEARGVLPSNAAYDAVVGAAIEAGLRLRPLMIIDTGTAEPLADLPTIGACAP